MKWILLISYMIQQMLLKSFFIVYISQSTSYVKCYAETSKHETNG